VKKYLSVVFTAVAVIAAERINDGRLPQPIVIGIALFAATVGYSLIALRWRIERIDP
jgi:hypothetical protein